MNSTIKILFLGLFFISCSAPEDEKNQILENRGTIKFEYNNEKLIFGEKSYTGWILNATNDTIGLFYTARIRYGTSFTDYHNFTLRAYLDSNKNIEKYKMIFEPRDLFSGYQYNLNNSSLIYKNMEFDGIWLKGEFEGRLYYDPYDLTDYTELKQGKINIPLKGLNIPDKY